MSDILAVFVAVCQSVSGAERESCYNQSEVAIKSHPMLAVVQIPELFDAGHVRIEDCGLGT